MERREPVGGRTSSRRVGYWLSTASAPSSSVAWLAKYAAAWSPFILPRRICSVASPTACWILSIPTWALKDLPDGKSFSMSIRYGMALYGATFWMSSRGARLPTAATSAARGAPVFMNLRRSNASSGCADFCEIVHIQSSAAQTNVWFGALLGQAHVETLLS